MATKGERFRAQTERRASQAKKTKRKPHSTPPLEVSSNLRARAALLERVDRATARLPHNTALRADKDSTYELEAAASGRPPRRSTRRSPSHLKPDTAMRNRATVRAASPKARAGRGRSGR